MSDVTTLVVVPDTTVLAVEEEEDIVLPGLDETILVSETDETIIVSPEESTQVVVSEETETIVVMQDSTVVVGADAAGPRGPQGPPGSGGGGGTATEAEAAVTLSAGRLITLDDTGARYFDPTTVLSYGKAVGVTNNAALAGDIVQITTIGPVVLAGMGYTPGQRFWAGPNGTLVTTPPSSGLVVPVGYAIDADTLNVQIESYLVW